MSRFWKIAVTLALALAVVQPALAEDPPSTRGAKSLFGQTSDSAFLPREQGGAAGSARMDPTNRVTDDMLASGIHKQPEFPGIAYSLEVLRRGETHITTVEDPRRYEFKTGDRVRMRLVPNFTGYAYVLEAKSNDTSLVYPATFGTVENRIIAGRECYVPAQGWLRLIDPAEPFTMQVLFKPGSVDYRLNQPAPNPATARVSLTEAVRREWRAQAGQKGMIFEADKSYVGTDPQPRQSPDQQQPVAHQQPVGQQSGGQQPVPTIDRSNYTTNYVVVDRTQLDPDFQQDQAAIAIEIPIRHVPR